MLRVAIFILFKAHRLQPFLKLGNKKYENKLKSDLFFAQAHAIVKETCLELIMGLYFGIKYWSANTIGDILSVLIMCFTVITILI